MSETVYYKGVLTPVKIEVDLLTTAKSLLREREVSYEGDEDILDLLEGEFYPELIVVGGILYRVQKEDIEDQDIFQAAPGVNSAVYFEVRYYNGGCGFHEALELALENMKQGESE